MSGRINYVLRYLLPRAATGTGASRYARQSRILFVRVLDRRRVWGGSMGQIEPLRHCSNYTERNGGDFIAREISMGSMVFRELSIARNVSESLEGRIEEGYSVLCVK